MAQLVVVVGFDEANGTPKWSDASYDADKLMADAQAKLDAGKIGYWEAYKWLRKSFLRRSYGKTTSPSKSAIKTNLPGVKDVLIDTATTSPELPVTKAN